MKTWCKGFEFFHSKFRLIAVSVIICLLLVTLGGGQVSQAALGGSPPSQDRPAFQQTPAATPTGGCDQDTLKKLIQLVSHEWAAQGATHDALIALNIATFTCYFSQAELSHCDILTLSELQLQLSQAEAFGQTAPVALQVAYANTLAACMGKLPSQIQPSALVSTPGAPAPPPQAPAATSAATPAAAVDCDALAADWLLRGEPQLATGKDLVPFYTVLLTCYAKTARLTQCNLDGLAQVHLDLRAATGKPITADTLRGYEPKLLPCLGLHPVLLAGFSGLVASRGGGGSGGGSGGGNGGGNGGNGGNGDGTGSGSQDNGGAAPGYGGPYAVKQVRSLGGETLQGQVCSLTAPFGVGVHTPRVSFVFNFAPGSAAQGGWTYTYNIPRAGEFHRASGTYTIGPPDKNGVLSLVMTGKDHVTFKGFDGLMPIGYNFDLVPAPGITCPGSK